jgi:GNAT superfamily N-acetyltransferase
MAEPAMITGPLADTPISGGRYTMTFQIRQLSTADYPFVISVIDQWWGGRQVADKLPRLFFEHFADTSFAAERDGKLAGFLTGFVSQARSGEAYIHFVGVDPAERGSGLGRLFYESFFQAAKANGPASWSARRVVPQELRAVSAVGLLRGG